MSTVRKDGYLRRVFDDYAQWVPLEAETRGIAFNYCVARLPFVTGYHLCVFDFDGAHLFTKILSTHKTLHEALDIVRVLEGGYA